MRVTLLPSFVGQAPADSGQYVTSYLVNDSLAVDAGALGLFGTPLEQARIRHVLLTHTHIDHIAGLPIFVDNVAHARPECVTIHGSAAVLDCLQRDIFNNRVWQDFIGLSTLTDRPYLKLATLEDGKKFELDGLWITPVAVDHVVPTQGLIIEDATSAVAIVSDTGPTEAIWARANASPNLQAVFLEASFPDALAGLAAAAKHLTPALFAGEVRKLARPARLIAVHIKPRYAREILGELGALGLPGLEIGRCGQEYVF